MCIRDRYRILWEIKPLRPCVFLKCHVTLIWRNTFFIALSWIIVTVSLLLFLLRESPFQFANQTTDYVSAYLNTHFQWESIRRMHSVQTSWIRCYVCDCDFRDRQYRQSKAITKSVNSYSLPSTPAHVYRSSSQTLYTNATLHYWQPTVITNWLT